MNQHTSIHNQCHYLPISKTCDENNIGIIINYIKLKTIYYLGIS